jgi:hypothetical protein
MKRKPCKAIFILVALTSLAGCASNKYEVLFDSTPQGATLVCGGNNWGYTPKRLYYDESVKSNAYLNVSSCSARWSSGVSANYPERLTVFPQGSTHINLPRPDSPGYTQDAEFALKVKELESSSQRQSAPGYQYTPPKTTNCMTTYGWTRCTTY